MDKAEIGDVVELKSKDGVFKGFGYFKFKTIK